MDGSGWVARHEKKECISLASGQTCTERVHPIGSRVRVATSSNHIPSTESCYHHVFFLSSSPLNCAWCSWHSLRTFSEIQEYYRVLKWKIQFLEHFDDLWPRQSLVTPMLLAGYLLKVHFKTALKVSLIACISISLSMATVREFADMLIRKRKISWHIYHWNDTSQKQPDRVHRKPAIILADHDVNHVIYIGRTNP